MMRKAHALALVIFSFLTLSGCNFQSTLDAMADRSRQEQIIATAQTLCSNPQSLQSQMVPELWTQLQPNLSRLQLECPPADATYALTAYNVSASVRTGAPSETVERTTVVAGTENGPWKVSEVGYVSTNGGPPLMFSVTVEPSAERPAALGEIETWNQVAMIGQIVLTVVGLLFVLGVWLLVRRSRRRKAARLAAAAQQTTAQ
jgi:hypothetical protein